MNILYKKNIVIFLSISAVTFIVVFLAFYLEDLTLSMLSGVFGKNIYYSDMEAIIQPLFFYH